MSRSRKKAIIKDKRRIKYNRMQRRADNVILHNIISIEDKENYNFPILFGKGDWDICDWNMNLEHSENTTEEEKIKYRRK